MATFLTGNELNAQLEKIFEHAQEQLILISPFIKLHDRYLAVLKDKKDNPKLDIVIVFGKNEKDPAKSMRQEDFNFFKELPNIEIRYEKNLHAKYHANESFAILTSMNLYSYSQDNNIEAGVKTGGKLWSGIDDVDGQAWNYFQRVIDQSELLFKRTPNYESAMFGLTKNYTKSTIELDKLSDFFNDRQKYEVKNPKDPNIKHEIPHFRENQVALGYCIRTSKQIPFNVKMPFSKEAYDNWAKFKNENYAEKYCHFSGEVSNGETSFAKPILKKNWIKAKEKFGVK